MPASRPAGVRRAQALGPHRSRPHLHPALRHPAVRGTVQSPRRTLPGAFRVPSARVSARTACVLACPRDRSCLPVNTPALAVREPAWLRPSGGRRERHLWHPWRHRALLVPKVHGGCRQAASPHQARPAAQLKPRPTAGWPRLEQQGQRACGGNACCQPAQPCRAVPCHARQCNAMPRVQLGCPPTHHAHCPAAMPRLQQGGGARRPARHLARGAQEAAVLCGGEAATHLLLAAPFCLPPTSDAVAAHPPRRVFCCPARIARKHTVNCYMLCHYVLC